MPPATEWSGSGFNPRPAADAATSGDEEDGLHDDLYPSPRHRVRWRFACAQPSGNAPTNTKTAPTKHPSPWARSDRPRRAKENP